MLFTLQDAGRNLKFINNILGPEDDKVRHDFASVVDYW